MDTQVLIRGLKTVMDVKAFGFDRRMLVQPSVMKLGKDLGVGVTLFEIDQPNDAVYGSFWGLTFPHLLFSTWRAMLIVQKLNTLEGRSLCQAFYAGQRNLTGSDRHYGEEIAEAIGPEVLSEIRAQRIPEDVLEIGLAIAAKEVDDIGWQITEEVEAGTLIWRPEYEALGILHPVQVTEKEASGAEILERYEQHLLAYANMTGHSDTGLLMTDIRSAIVEAVMLGVEDRNGEDVVMALAIAISHGTVGALTHMFGFADPDQVRDAVEEGVEEAAEWASSYFKQGRYWWWQRSIHSRQEYREIVRTLLREWPQMPIIHPLYQPLPKM